MKKTVFILNVLMGIAIIAFTSCVKEEEGNGSGRAEVRFTGNLSKVLTRVSGTDGTHWDADDPVGIYMVKADPGTLSDGNILTGNKPYKASAGTTATFSPEDGTQLTYPSDGSSVKFVAYHPYSASVGNDYTLPVSVANQSNLSAIDVLYAPATPASDKTASAPVELGFAHKLSKLVFTISNGTGVTEPVTNGVTVSISKQKTTATLDLTDGTVTASGTATATVTATGAATVEAIVLPAASLSDVEFTFTNHAGQRFTVSVPDGSWQGGYRYTYTVTLKGTDKQADITGSISSWNDGGNTPITGNETAEVPEGNRIKMTLNPSGLTRAAGGTVRLWLAGTGDAVINWGDGNTNTYPLGATALGIDHLYVDGTDYVATITGRVSYLDCKGNRISALDVTGNPTLTYLNCSGNLLTSLDLSSNPLLAEVLFSNNPFEGVDLSGNTTVTSLALDGIPIKSLNLSGCTALKKVESRSNGMTAINVGGCTALVILNLYGNKVESIDVTECTALKELYMVGSPLTSLDLSHNPALTTLYIHNGKLTELDVSHNLELRALYCRNNLFTELDVTRNPKLEKLSCGWNQLTSLNVKNNPLLNGLYFEHMNIPTIDLSNNPLLDELACYNTGLNHLGLSGNPKLRHVECFGNRLMELDLSNNTQLEILYCQSNQLWSMFDLSNNTLLRDVNVSSNQITGLNISGLLNLWSLNCKDNQISSGGIQHLYESLHNRLCNYDGYNYLLESAFEPWGGYSYDKNKSVSVAGNLGYYDTYIAEEKGWTVVLD